MAKFRETDFTNGAKRVAENGPAELKDLVLAGRKRMPGEPHGGGCQRSAVERVKVFRQQPDLFQFAADTANGSAGFGESHKPRLGSRNSRREEAFADLRFGSSDFGFRSLSLLTSAATATHHQRQSQLLLLAQRPRVEAQVAQRLRKIRRKPVQSVNTLRRDALHELDQIGEIRMVAQWKRGIGLIT